MPDALPLTGLFGKVPAHGDFVRRGLPTSFVGPWDSWLQDGMATARETLGDRWAACWDGAPPWRFALPAGACGPDAVAGVMLPSEDMVGRRFPITLAVLLPPGAPTPTAAWFAALEAAALAGRAGQADADALAAAIPLPGHEPPEPEAPPMAWSPAEPADPLPFALAPESGAVPPAGDVLPEGLPLWPQATDAPGDEPPTAPGDVLAMFSGGTAASEQAPSDSTGSASTPATAIDSPLADAGVLDVFGGGTEAPGAAESFAAGSLLGMFGAEQVASDPLPEASPGDVLDFFSRTSSPDGAAAIQVAAAPPHMATPDAPAPTDQTLAFLLGEGGDAPAAPDPGPAGDPLASLIAAGDAGPMPLLTDLAGPAPMPMPAAFDPRPEAGLLAPPPPEHGGWWTGGGGRLPPSARALPALIPAGAFASLLEADA